MAEQFALCYRLMHDADSSHDLRLQDMYYLLTDNCRYLDASVDACTWHFASCQVHCRAWRLLFYVILLMHKGVCPYK